MVSGESSGHTSSDQDAQAAPETDAIDQGLSALEKRLAIELKVWPKPYMQISVF